VKAPLKVAAVGLGWVCTHRHLPVMQQNSALEVFGVIDSNSKRAHEVASKFGVFRIGTTRKWGEIPWFDEVDALTIAVSPFSHYEAIKAGLEADKHILTEKPFVLDVAQGRELVELAEKRGKVLGIVHNFQFSNSFLRLKRDIEIGKLGRITSVQAFQFSNPRRRLPVWYDELPLGLFTDESPHLLYLLRAISPDIKLVDARKIDQFDKNTPALLSAEFTGTCRKNTIPLTIQFNFTASVSEWQLSVFGERGCGFVDVFRDIYIRLPNDGLHTTKTVVTTSASTIWQHIMGNAMNASKHLRGELFYGNETVFERFADAIQNDRIPRGISATDALAVLELQHQVIEKVS
jgi:scyllo-inositol 2-dehydrogenase (NADP+)